MKNIKAIIFDAYGTLFDVNSAAEKCKDKIGSKWESFANYWRTTQLEYTWLRSLMNRHKDFWQVTEDSLDKSMKAFKINLSTFSLILKDVNLIKVLNISECFKFLNFLTTSSIKSFPNCSLPVDLGIDCIINGVIFKRKSNIRELTLPEALCLPLLS